MPVPDDPQAFIAAAERGINERDLEGTAGVYAQDAFMQTLTDGAEESFHGAGAVRGAWASYLEAMAARDFRLAKTIVSVCGDVICNEWTGTLGGHTESRGIEYWVFDGEGRVREHRLYTFLDVRPSTSPVQRVRMGLAYPRTALSFLRAQRKRSRGVSRTAR
ncbi:MAG TPA: nuclear transport factor 2 family protein [Solirubrobacterales bacterium]